MNTLHMPSVVKAGGIAAAVAIVWSLLSFIPLVGDYLALCFVCGGFLIPIGAGLAYGYFAPGEEDLTQSAVGGTLAGGASGILLGIFVAIQGSISSGISEGLGSAIAAGAAGTFICAGGLGIGGLIFGAIGGLLWPLIQQQMGK